MDLEWYFIYKFIGAKVPTATTRLLPQVRVLQVFKFLQQTELLYIILYQYLLQLEWERTSTGTVNLEVSPQIQQLHHLGL